MRYLLLLFLSCLQLSSFAQQSALDSLAIQIQTYVNKSNIKLDNRWFGIASTKDSLYLDSSLNFIRSIPFDRSILTDSVVYNLRILNDPNVDTVIVDVFSAGWDLGEVVFVTNQVSGEFFGGFKKHSEQLFNYIHHCGLSISDSIAFRVYFNKKAPYNGFYVESQDSSLSRLVLDYYNTIALKKYNPPIKNGRPYFSSYLFKYKDSVDRVYYEDYQEYDNLLMSDQYIFSLEDWKSGDSLSRILVFDRKKNLKDIITPKFLNQFEEEHQTAIRDLVIGRGYEGESNVLKFEIKKR